MTAYHLFREGDAHFVFHHASGRFIRVSPEAYDLLELRERLSAEEATAAFRARHPDAASVLADVAALEAEGFFEPAEPPVKDDAEFEDELEKRFSGPCNTLVLTVASGCNLACRYCYCGVCRDELPDKGLMPEATALQAVDRLFAAADPKVGVRITFFGGEPLLNKPVIRSVVARCNELAAARGQKAGYSITTNATLMDDETADLIIKNNFGLMASLDGPQPLHDGQCPTRAGGGSFALAAAGIRKLLARGARVTVRCTMAHPAPDALELIRFFSDFGGNQPQRPLALLLCGRSRRPGGSELQVDRLHRRGRPRVPPMRGREGDSVDGRGTRRRAHAHLRPLRGDRRVPGRGDASGQGARTALRRLPRRNGRGAGRHALPVPQVRRHGEVGARAAGGRPRHESVQGVLARLPRGDPRGLLRMLGVPRLRRTVSVGGRAR